MQRKLNQEFIKEYSRQFSEKITSEFFENRETINGKEILNITPSRQVNFFILKILFGNWQEEMKKLESPYFNYRDPEVRRAMVEFMNTLSQNIEMDEDHLYELMQEAVADAITLAVLPQKFLYDELIQRDITSVNHKITRPLLKYLKLYREYFEEFFSENDNEELSTFLDRSREFFEGIDVQEVAEAELLRLSEVRQIDLSDVVDTGADEQEDVDDFTGPDFEVGLQEDDEDTPEHYQAEERDEAPQEEPVAQEPDVAEQDEVPEEPAVQTEEEPEPVEYSEDLSTEAPRPHEEEETTADEPEEEEPVHLSSESSISGSDNGIYTSEMENTFGENPAPELEEDFSSSSAVEEESADLPDEVETKREEMARLTEEEPDEDAEDTIESDDQDADFVEKEPLNKRFSGENTTINDRYANEDKFTLAEDLEKKEVESIMDAISVNHRYMFTKELFEGDRDEFVKAISRIEQSGSFDDAVEILVQNYAKTYSWDMNSEEVKELLKVVFRKFR